MEKLETKNDLVRILFSPKKEKKILLGDFLALDDINETVFAQVIDIESSKSDEFNVAICKLILIYNMQKDEVSFYNGYTPSKEANIKYLNPVEITRHLKRSDKNIVWGNLTNSNLKFQTTLFALNNNFYIISDNKQDIKILNSNIIQTLQQYNAKFVIIDFDNRYEHKFLHKLKPGVDFKIPLSAEAVEFLIKNDIIFGAIENKVIVESILIELKDYISTLNEGFLPFDVLVDVIDKEYKASKMTELALFKNKLNRYIKKNIFANSKEEIDSFNKKILDFKFVSICLDGFDEKLQKYLLQYFAKNIATSAYFLLFCEDPVTDKSILKDIFQNGNLYPIISSYFHFSQSFYIKSQTSNTVLFKQFEKTKDFASYASFINKLNYDEFIIWGKNTLYIPFILKLEKFDYEYEEFVEKQIKQDVDSMLSKSHQTENIDKEDVEEKDENSFSVEEFVDDKFDEIYEEPNKETENHINTLFTKNIKNINLFEDEPENVINQGHKDTLESPSTSLENEIFSDVDESTSLPPETENALDFVESASEEDIEDQLPSPSLKNEISSDVDESTSLPPKTENALDFVEEKLESKEQQEDDFSFDDGEMLDFIDISEFDEKNDSEDDEFLPNFDENKEKNNSNEEITNEEVDENKEKNLQEKVDENVLVKEESNDIPVYEAKIDNNFEANYNFVENERVFHPKYGNGCIEKVINYGDKMLLSIQFEKVGRRLLNPQIAPIQKVQ